MEGGCVNLMCPGTKATVEAGGAVAEKMLVLVVVITAAGEQRAHVGPVCLVTGGGGGGVPNLWRHSPSPRIKQTHKWLNLHDGICNATKSSVSPD